MHGRDRGTWQGVPVAAGGMWGASEGRGSPADRHCPGTAWLAGRQRDAELLQTRCTAVPGLGPSVPAPVATPVQPVTSNHLHVRATGMGVLGDPRHGMATSTERDKL